MNVSPLDLRQQRFSNALRGFDKVEVTSLLMAVADDIRQSAEKAAEEIRRNAEEEARRLIREAQGRSDLLLEKTQTHVDHLHREIDGLKLKRREVETSIESIVQTLRNTLEFVREQDNREREDKVLLHRPWHVESEANIG